MLKFDHESRRVVREGVPNEVNPYDVLGTSVALDLKSEHDAEVAVITMGPPQASEALVQAMALGADRAIHLNDRAFAGSDTLATSRALALALGREAFDLIICGRNSTDAETGQVGPEIAEMLDLPQITGVSRLTVDPDAGLVNATRLTDEGHQQIECNLPVVVTVTDGVAQEVYPRPDAIEQARSRPIEVVTAADLSADPSQFGLEGSPTWVNEIFSLESSRLGTVVRDIPTEEAVSRLMAFLDERGVFSGEAAVEDGGVQRGPRQGPGEQGAMWVVAETMGGEVRPVTLELLGRSREMAAEIGTPVDAVLIGDVTESHIETLTAYGADTVHIATAPGLEGYDTEAHASVLASAIRELKPFSVLVPSTANGRDLAARVAGRLGLGLTGDCVGLEIDDEGRLSQLKPAFGGTIVAPILSRTTPAMATVRSGILSSCTPDDSITPVVNDLRVDRMRESRVRVLETVVDESSEGAKLERAARIVSVGKGIGGPGNLGPIRKLADALDASIGTTRDVADLGWLPRQYQIGLSGKSVAPELYIAVAIRGPFNHTVGMQRSGTVVAINNSARSPIFRAADFGILGDWKDIVPALTAAVRLRLDD